MSNAKTIDPYIESLRYMPNQEPILIDMRDMKMSDLTSMVTKRHYNYDYYDDEECVLEYTEVTYKGIKETTWTKHLKADHEERWGGAILYPELDTIYWLSGIAYEYTGLLSPMSMHETVKRTREMYSQLNKLGVKDIESYSVDAMWHFLAECEIKWIIARA